MDLFCADQGGNMAVFAGGRKVHWPHALKNMCAVGNGSRYDGDTDAAPLRMKEFSYDC